MQRSLEQRYVRDQVLRETRKVWFRNVEVEDSLCGCCFVFRWHKAFKDGRESVEDEQRADRPSTARTENNVARVKIVLDRDRRLQVRLIAGEVGLPKTDAHRIITEDLHMRKSCAKLVPKNLSDEQKDNRVLVSREILDRVTSEPDFLQGVITGDETWVFEYDPTRVVHFRVTSTKEGPNEQIKCEIHAHQFFFIQGNCSQGVCATWTDCESNILPTGTRAFEKQS